MAPTFGLRASLPAGVYRLAALVAWRLRLPGAGPRFAAADDRWHAVRGLPPRYDACPHADASGDLRLSPFVGASDEERRRLGLPARAEQLRHVEEQNKRNAEARWRRSWPRDGVHLERVWRPVTAAELEARWASEGSPVWRDGDVLTVVHRADADEVQVVPGIQLDMWRVEDDLWALMVRVRDLDRAALSLSCVALSRGPRERTLPEPVTWRGPDAPPAPPRAESLAGELRLVELDSRALGERRAVTVYLPPERQERPPVVYLADGGSVPRFAAVLEPGVVAGTTPAAVLVGVHGAVSAPLEDRRGREYLPGRDPRRFEAHRRFFVDEVGDWAERELGVSADRERRAVGGYSNGAVLASALGCRHSDRFGAVIAFSLGIQPPLRAGARPARHTWWPAPWRPGSTAPPTRGPTGCASGAWRSRSTTASAATTCCCGRRSCRRRSGGRSHRGRAGRRFIDDPDPPAG